VPRILAVVRSHFDDLKTSVEGSPFVENGQEKGTWPPAGTLCSRRRSFRKGTIDGADAYLGRAGGMMDLKERIRTTRTTIPHFNQLNRILMFMFVF